MTTQDTTSTAAPAKAPRVTITEQLYALFDQVGEEALSMGFAQDLAVAHGFNRTSAGISFCRWRQRQNRHHGLSGAPHPPATAALRGRFALGSPLACVTVPGCACGAVQRPP